MKHSPLARSTKPMKRSRLRGRSAKTIAAVPDRGFVRDQVFARDGFRCLLSRPLSLSPSLFLILSGGPLLGHKCFGPNTPHHILKAGQGGSYDTLNLVTLCVLANDLVEEYPGQAWNLGLVQLAGDSLADCWQRMVSVGLADYVPAAVLAEFGTDEDYEHQAERGDG